MSSTKKKRRRRQRRRWPVLVGLLIALLIVLFLVRTSIFYHWAEQAIAERDFARARKHLAWVARLTRGAPRQKFLLGRIARLESRSEAMNQHLRDAAQAGFDATMIERETWLAAAQSGQLQDAHRRVHQLLVDPRGDEREICEAYAIGFMQARDYNAAKQLLVSWGKDFPNAPRPRYLLGMIQMEERQLAAAEQSFRDALRLDKSHAGAAFQLGSVILDGKRPEEALDFLEQAVPDKEHGVQARILKARCLRLLGHPAKAREVLTEVLNEEAKNLDAILEMARIDLDQQQYQKIVERLLPLVEQDPRRTNLRMVLGQAYRGLQNDELADKHLQAVAEKSQKLMEANALADKISLGPESAPIRHQIGMIYLKYGSDAEGTNWLMSALNADPDFEPTLRALTEHYEQIHAPQHAAPFRQRLEQLQKRNRP